MGYYSDEYRNTYTTVLKELDTALGSVDPAAVEALADAVLDADQVFFVGVGRVLLSLQSIAKRLAHLGICTHYVGEITEPAITGNDLLIVGSGSGSTLFPLGIAKKAKVFGFLFPGKKLRPTKIHSASVDVRNLYASRSCCADARRILRKRSRASEIRFYREFDSCPYQHRPGYLGENLQKQSSAG